LAISTQNTENSSEILRLKGQVIVESGATSSEVCFSPAALDEYRAPLGFTPRLIDELAARAD
jgi:hypothetical protein